MIKLPRHIYPKDLSLSEGYSHFIRGFNKVLQGRIRTFLESSLSDRDGQISILTTGSDGRLEKGPVSEMEFIILREDTADAEQKMSKVIDKINNCPNELADKDIEIKILGKNSMSNYRGYLITPMRISDSVLLAGSEEIYAKARMQFLGELFGETGKKILETMKEKKRGARKVTDSGSQRYKQQDLIHFDLDTGESYYDPLANSRSFKEGPLRFVQYSLMHDIIKYFTTQDKEKSFKMLENLPKNTEEKLRYLWVKELSSFTQGEINDLIDNYLFFLYQYHISQEAFKLKNRNIVEFDKNEVKKRLDDLVLLMAKPFIKVEK